MKAKLFVFMSFSIVSTPTSSLIVSCSLFGSNSVVPNISGSNIKNGNQGAIFQSSNGVLWSMGENSLLQYLDEKNETWKHDTDAGLTKGSNIVSGQGGSIFESSDNTLWSMGAGTSLQYFDSDNSTWVSSTDDSTSKTYGSNITDGMGGCIYESSDKILWTMGSGSTLQYFSLENNDGWNNSTVEANSKTYNSNISNGSNGVIFESKNTDETTTIWSMGDGTSLQYYDTTASSWTSDTTSGLTKGSNITSGSGGCMFQSKDGTLWSMGAGTALQYYDATNSSWEDSTSDASLKTYNSNITDGQKGVIFQDSSGTLWSMGNGTSLQYYDDISKSWVSDNKDPTSKTYGSNIVSGYGGTIFEDASGTLWCMGENSTLEYYDTTFQTWISSAWFKLSKVKNSNIIDGNGGVMFETNDRVIWSMSKESELQYYNPLNNGWDSLTSN